MIMFYDYVEAVASLFQNKKTCTCSQSSCIIGILTSISFFMRLFVRSFVRSIVRSVVRVNIFIRYCGRFCFHRHYSRHMIEAGSPVRHSLATNRCRSLPTLNSAPIRRRRTLQYCCVSQCTNELSNVHPSSIVPGMPHLSTSSCVFSCFGGHITIPPLSRENGTIERCNSPPSIVCTILNIVPLLHSIKLYYYSTQ